MAVAVSPVGQTAPLNPDRNFEVDFFLSRDASQSADDLKLSDPFTSGSPDTNMKAAISGNSLYEWREMQAYSVIVTPDHGGFYCDADSVYIIARIRLTDESHTDPDSLNDVWAIHVHFKCPGGIAVLCGIPGICVVTKYA